jgi:hypothetical protein
MYIMFKIIILKFLNYYTLKTYIFILFLIILSLLYSIEYLYMVHKGINNSEINKQ